MRTVAALCRELNTDSRSDGELLSAFLAGSAEAAFGELIRRHGPLVWGTCRRLLPDPSDAEDAFQAAFLVLVRRARSLTRNPCVGPWLHRVAVWTARNVRRKNARRLARQTALPDHVPDTPAGDPDLKVDLDDALLALPARYRDPIVLCHLLGFTRREAAERLGCPEGTLSGWLNRGLAKLRVRLRGLDPAKVLSVPAVGVPAALGASTARAAVAVTAASVPPTVSVLVEGVLHMFWVKKATAATFAMCAVFVMGVGVGLGTRMEQTGAVAQDKKSSDPKTKTEGPSPADIDKEIAGLEQVIAACELAQKYAAEGAAEANKRYEALKRRAQPDDKDLQDAMKTLQRFQQNQDDATAKLKEAKEHLAKLKTAKQPQPPANADLAKLDAELERLKANLAILEAEAAIAQDRAKETAVRAALLREQAAELQRLKEELMKRGAGAAKLDPGGYIELTISGKAGEFEFVLREVPVHDINKGGSVPVYGPVTTRDPQMLAKLLARAKSDPTAPKDVRVIAQPQTVLGGGPSAALKAADAAGFKTVKFTGYVFQGGFATPLKPDQTGDAPGYKRYNATERKAEDLIKEITEGMRRL